MSSRQPTGQEHLASCHRTSLYQFPCNMINIFFSLICCVCVGVLRQIRVYSEMSCCALGELTQNHCFHENGHALWALTDWITGVDVYQSLFKCLHLSASFSPLNILIYRSLSIYSCCFLYSYLLSPFEFCHTTNIDFCVCLGILCDKTTETAQNCLMGW